MPKILIADDSNMLRDMLKFALQDGGYSDISEASNGAEALQMSQREQFDLVITDVNMPDVNGLELIKALRSMPQYAKVPLLVLTTEKADDVKTQGKIVGATGWITKPFSPEQVLKAVKFVLSR